MSVEQRTEYREQQERTPMPIILTSDFGNHLSPGECKIIMGRITRAFGYSQAPSVEVHDIEGFDIMDGGAQLRQLAITQSRSLAHLDLPVAVKPEPAVFGIVVDPGVGSGRRIVIAQTESGNQYIGPDNTVLSLALGRESITKAYAIKDEVYQGVAATFHGRDLIAPTAIQLACHADPSKISYLDGIDPKTIQTREISDGTVIHVDGYGGKQGEPNYGGNVKLEGQGIPTHEGERPTEVTVTLPKRIWHRGLPRRRFTATVGRTFEDVQEGGLLLYTGSSGDGSDTGEGHQELAIRNRKGRKSAAGKLQLYPGNEVGLEWKYPNQSGHTLFSRKK